MTTSQGQLEGLKWQFELGVCLMPVMFNTSFAWQRVTMERLTLSADVSADDQTKPYPWWNMLAPASAMHWVLLRSDLVSWWMAGED